MTRLSFRARARFARHPVDLRALLARVESGLRGRNARAGVTGDRPASHVAASVVLRAVYPLALWGLPTLLVAYGAPLQGLIAAAGGFMLLKRPRRGWPRLCFEIAGASLFLGGLALGVPRTAYLVATEACVEEAQDTATGDVRSLADTRLTDPDRRWVIRAANYLSLGWPTRRLPPVNEATLANIVVKAPVVVAEIKWRGPNTPLTGLGLWEAKEAYAAGHFDRRRVCALFQAGAHSTGHADQTDLSRRIVGTTDQALALILPALQATYEPPTTLN